MQSLYIDSGALIGVRVKFAKPRIIFGKGAGFIFLSVIEVRLHLGEEGAGFLSRIGAADDSALKGRINPAPCSISVRPRLLPFIGKLATVTEFRLLAEAGDVERS
jgi:hypothetical protein